MLGLRKKMTIFEDEVIHKPVQYKLPLYKELYNNRKYLVPVNNTCQFKRLHPGDEQFFPSKKASIKENMPRLNEYRFAVNDHVPRNDDDEVVFSEPPIATLANMGNTCFLNTVIYTMRFLPTFLHNLHHLIDDLSKVNYSTEQNKMKSSSLGRNVDPFSGPSSRSISGKDLSSLENVNDVVPKSKVQIFTEKFHELFVTLYNIEENRRRNYVEAYQPIALLQAIREANYIFEGNHQQDAHELLVYLLDNIRETCDLLGKQINYFPEVLTDTGLKNNSNSKLWKVQKSRKR